MSQPQYVILRLAFASAGRMAASLNAAIEKITTSTNREVRVVGQSQDPDELIYTLEVR